MKLLITGGAGYIGSHTVLELLEQDHDIVVMDNLSNASLEALKRVEKITGKSVTFYEVDLRDKDGMDQIFSKEKIEGVIHFAGLKAVGESVEKPLMYYENNVSGTVNLLQVMAQHNVKILSSVHQQRSMVIRIGCRLKKTFLYLQPILMGQVN